MTGQVRTPVRTDRVLSCPLKIRVGGEALEAHPGLRVYAAERARSALDHLERRVECLAINVSTLDLGPDPGATCCRIWARLKSGRQLREESKSKDPYAAIDAAAEAAARDVEYLESRLPPATDLRCA